MNKGQLLFILLGIFCFTTISGCGSKWTIISFVNLSKDEIWVEIDGGTPNISAGVLLPGTGTSRLTESTLEFFKPVKFDDLIKITWNLEGETTKKTVELKREDYGIPPEVHGGTIKIIYTEAGKWRMEYSKDWE
jgi:hypothetical protein